jgi:hypothetical protein
MEEWMEPFAEGADKLLYGMSPMCATVASVKVLGYSEVLPYDASGCP